MYDSPLAGALAYAKRGWPVFPVKENKQPAIKDWKTKATTDENQIRRWFEQDFIGGCNFGFQPGLAGIAVIDIDCGKKRKREDGTEETVNGEDSLADFLKQSGAELPSTYTVQTPSGGTHLYFKADGIGNKNGFLPAVDVKSCGGFVVVPGSKSPAGTYAVERDVPVAELPGALDEAFRRGFPKKEAVEQPRGVPGDWIDFASVLETVRNMDPILCGSRDTRLFAICAEWKERGVTLEGMRQLLRLMNDLGKIEAGDDPLDEHDFDRISKSAWNRKETQFGTKSVGALLTGPGTPDADGYAAAELPSMEIPPIDFLVQGLIPEGLSIIGGAAKTGKTYLLLQLAVSLASGTPFLGRDVPKKRRVLYYYLEGGRRQVKTRFEELYGAEFSPPADLIFVHRFPRLGSGGLSVLEQHIERYSPEVVIFDTWQLIRTPVNGKATAYEKEYAELALIRGQIMTKFGVSVFLAHHLKQFRRGDITDPMSMFNGSTAISGAVDTAMIMFRERFSETATLSVLGRDIGDTAIELVQKKPMGWKESEDGGSVRLVGNTELQQQIISALESHPDGLTARELAKRLPGEQYWGIQKQLKRWFDNGKIDMEKKRYRLFSFMEDVFDEEE